MGKCLRPDRCGHCDPGAGARRMARPTAAPGLYGVGPVGGHVPASARVGFHSRVLESVEVTFKQGQSVFDVLKTPDIQRISGVLSSRYEKGGFAPQEKIEWLVFSCISLK